MAKCKSCGATILWIGTVNGKKMPCDAEQVVYWQDPKGETTIITPNGETIRATLQTQRTPATGIGYIPHWVTCPQANKHRRGKNDQS
jgi:hypothetical protein